MKFPRAFLVAVLAHGFVFLLVLFTFKGDFQGQESNLVFWGSILRGQDVVPVEKKAEVGFESAVVKAPLLQGAARFKTWESRVIVDKPAGDQRVVSEGELPPKFSTERVRLDDDVFVANDQEPLDLPEAPRVLLKLPQR